MPTKTREPKTKSRAVELEERHRQAALHTARGMFKHLPGSLDEFLEERHEVTLLEERKHIRNGA